MLRYVDIRHLGRMNAILILFLAIDLSHTKEVPKPRVSSNGSSSPTSTSFQRSHLASEIASYSLSNKPLC